MKYILPQEIQVWHILPVIRRELSRILVREKGMTQKRTAEILSLTEGAVSQYLNEKRGNSVKFTDEVMEEVRKSADIIADDKSRVMEETIRLLNMKSMWKIICRYHREHDPNVRTKCRICEKHGVHS